MKSDFLRRAGALLLLLALLGSLLAVPAAAADDTDVPAPVPVVRVDASPSSLALDKDGTGQLQAVIQPSNASNQNVIWSSSDPRVATVDQDGLVTAVGGGTAVITAAPEDTSRRPTVNSCTVTVRIPAEQIILRQSEVTLAEGETASFPGFEILPLECTEAVDWDIGDTGVVTNSGGRLLGVRAGTTTLTVHPRGKSSPSAVCQVTVTAAADILVSSVKLNHSTYNLTTDGRLELTATVTPSNAQNKEILWDVSDSSVLSLSANRGSKTVVTVKRGASLTPQDTGYTVYATSEGNPAAYALCVVRIVGPQPTQVNRVQITSPNTDDFKYVDPGASFTLNALASPSDAPEADREIYWSSSNPSVATVDQTGKVTGVAVGKATIYASAAGDGTIRDSREIEVSGLKLKYLRRSTSGGKGQEVALTPSSEVSIYQYYDISVTADAFGSAKGRAINWESSNNTVAQVVNGRVTANYPGENVTITASVAGTGYSASFKVKVSEDVADAVIVDMGSAPSYSFSGILGALSSRSQSKVGAPLESIYNLKVSPDEGTLYYKYISANSPGHGVGGTESYYYQPSSSQQMALRDVTFIPKPGFTGTSVVDYNAKGTNGTTFTGTIRIEVTSTGDVSYSTEMDQPVTFSAEHFSDVCRGRNGQAIRYVTFDQPASSRGTLYQDYAPPGLYSPKVSSSTRYYVSSKPSINQVTFVPATGFVGEAALTYHCTDSAGTSYTGTVTIRVASPSGTQGGNVEYSTGVNQRRSLNAGDFNDACQRVTNGTLNCIRFESLPSTSAGRLYLNYSSSSSTGTQVLAGRNYYRSSTPRISNITFVPASNYNGTVTIPYTGTNASGTNFSGNLIIHVGTGSTGTTIRYTVPRNQTVGFNASDFNNVCRSATGDTLNYIRFTSLPSSTYGTLYSQYNYGTGSGTTANTSTSYYYSGSTRPIGSLTFAAKSASGSTTFGFTGYNSRGNSFSGTVAVEVSGGDVPTGTSANIYYSGSSAPIPFRASDFQSACRTSLGTTLASVQFNTLPAAGRLCQNYSSSGRPGTSAAASVRYGVQELDQFSYLPQAGYEGTITIPYTAYDTQGGTHSGTVQLQISNGYSYATFSDLGGVAWAAPSIEFLRQSGITNGYSDNTFRPRQAISRGEFTLMICRAFQFSTTGSSGFPDVPAGSVYAGAVGTARDLGIVQGNNGLFQPDRAISRQSAMTMISRAMDAAGRSLPNASTAVLSSYADGGQVSPYARSAVAALIQSGAVRGTSDMRINPTAPISRAEMAVILHRVLTQ